ncbi:phosphoenolpyruvate hydrolase family protein [Extibacter muris]|uniref:TIM-barrel domain-containing protein n=1 Tax=Extibacter muris TaxID=1796622 RepID=A0A4R4FDZ0_9FIRM|nr:phosphoenolpyruvate hydrolase family protein [Extibacter muris]MCU0078437.1 phosphoenolpyruvate hydrolase family protein [Extibacter muris]TDA21568.1 hypothetical protein E1963_11265 [Extibacter muris]
MIYSDLRPFILFHGGPFTTAEDMDICLDRAAVHGVFSGSAAERIPVERTVMHTVAEEGARQPIRCLFCSGKVQNGSYGREIRWTERL